PYFIVDVLAVAAVEALARKEQADEILELAALVRRQAWPDRQAALDDFAPVRRKLPRPRAPVAPDGEEEDAGDDGQGNEKYGCQGHLIMQALLRRRRRSQPQHFAGEVAAERGIVLRIGQHIDGAIVALH